jgi:4'-phosphopantetheinyl transferase
MTTEHGFSNVTNSTAALRPFSVAPDVWLSARPVSVERAPVTDSDLETAADMAEREAQRFLGARGLLRKLVARIRPAAATAEIVVSGAGAPSLAGHDDLAVSMSQDGEWVAAVAGRTSAVGVDITEPVPGAGDRLASEYLNGYSERLVHLQDHERDVEMAWVWTAREACRKALGAEPSGEPLDVDVPPFSVAGQSGNLLWRSPRSLSVVPLSCAFSID